MNLENLLHQIQILRQVEAAENLLFDMGFWIGKPEQTGRCGTTLCAFGYACLDPVFQAKGLSLQVSHSRLLLANRNYTHNESVPLRTEITTIAQFNALALERGTVVPHFNGQTGFEAAVEFFGITPRAANWLFDPGAYHSDAIEIDHVIRRIEMVIECGGDAPADDDEMPPADDC